MKIGFNAEVVRSKIGEGTKVPHFCHVGDAIIGKNCNIAAGVIFCNFDGEQKSVTTIGDNVFIGSGVMLITSAKHNLRIGDHAYIAAGAIISKDVKPHYLMIGINKTVKEKRAFKWRLYSISEHKVW